jgi:hypothetical protein
VDVDAVDVGGVKFDGGSRCAGVDPEGVGISVALDVKDDREESESGPVDVEREAGSGMFSGLRLKVSSSSVIGPGGGVLAEDGGADSLSLIFVIFFAFSFSFRSRSRSFLASFARSCGVLAAG